MLDASSHLSADQINHIMEQVRAFTMVPPGGLLFTIEKALDVAASGLPGILVECGVWRGGSSMAMLLAQRVAFGEVRKPVYMLDSFEGLPPATGRDGPQANAWQANKQGPTYYDNCRAELEMVLAAFREKDFGPNDFRVFKGWFNDTLPRLCDELEGKPIAMLRLDADWYDSTMTCLKYLEPLISDGGIVIIDDYYTWEGCARALHDYFSRRDLSYRIKTIDSSMGAWFVKQGNSELTAKGTQIGELEPDQIIQAITLKLEMKEKEVTSLAQKLAVQEEIVADIEAKYLAIQESLSWRITSPLRAALDRHPRLLVVVRRTLKVLWWGVTFQLIAQFRRRRRSRHIVSS